MVTASTPHDLNTYDGLVLPGVPHYRAVPCDDQIRLQRHNAFQIHSPPCSRPVLFFALRAGSRNSCDANGRNPGGSAKAPYWRERGNDARRSVKPHRERSAGLTRAPASLLNHAPVSALRAVSTIRVDRFAATARNSVKAEVRLLIGHVRNSAYHHERHVEVIKQTWAIAVASHSYARPRREVMPNFRQPDGAA